MILIGHGDDPSCDIAIGGANQLVKLFEMVTLFATISETPSCIRKYAQRVPFDSKLIGDQYFGTEVLMQSIRRTEANEECVGQGAREWFRLSLTPSDSSNVFGEVQPVMPKPLDTM